MPTIIEGNKGDKCDARCYNGKPTTRCVCICGGENHAKGLVGALDNMREKLLEIEKDGGPVHPFLKDPEATVVFKRRGEPNTVGDAIIFVRFKDGTRNHIRHVIRHSPTGMNFGYGGSGPADAARSILNFFYGGIIADRLYMDFKWRFVAHVDQGKGGELPFEEIDLWVKNRAPEKGLGR